MKIRISNQSKFTRSKAGNVINLLFLVVLSIVMATPMVYTISSAFKPMNELFLFPPKMWVSNPTFANFTNLSSILRESWIPMSRYFVNSVVITVAGVAGQVLFASMAAYVLSRESFPGKKMLNSIVILSLMFSGSVTGIPNYLILSRMGLINSQLAIILPAFSSSLGLFLMKQFMDQMVPFTIIEAARTDGANEWYIFSRIAMIMCRPAWLTLIIFSFQGLWSNTGSAYIYDEQLKTLPYALNNIVSGGSIARAGVSAAVALILILPPLITFIITQSNVLETMSTSGMKD